MRLILLSSVACGFTAAACGGDVLSKNAADVGSGGTGGTASGGAGGTAHAAGTGNEGGIERSALAGATVPTGTLKAMPRLSGAVSPPQTQDRQVAHSAEVAIVRDQGVAVFLQGDCELDCVRQPERVAQAEASGKHRDIGVDVTNGPAGVLGHCSPVTLGESILAGFERPRDHLRNGDGCHQCTDATAVDVLEERAKRGPESTSFEDIDNRIRVDEYRGTVGHLSSQVHRHSSRSRFTALRESRPHSPRPDPSSERNGSLGLPAVTAPGGTTSA